MKLYHFTANSHVPLIKASGKLNLESKPEFGFKWPLPLYTWFTSDPSLCLTAFNNTGVEVRLTDITRLTFNTNSIKAYQWKMIKRTFKTKEQKDIASMLDDKTVEANDHPDMYWVSKVPVSMDLCEAIDTNGSWPEIQQEYINTLK